tara:strand:+ start:105 stop:416 length:312 start_codon:yes stop_codon:yes gene_type:complete
MHLVGPYLTTTRYNQKKSNRKKSARQIKSEAEHNKFLRKMGIDPDATRSVKCYGSTSDSKPESRGSTPRTDAKKRNYTMITALTIIGAIVIVNTIAGVVMYGI